MLGYIWSYCHGENIRGRECEEKLTCLRYTRGDASCGICYASAAKKYGVPCPEKITQAMVDAIELERKLSLLRRKK
jgi:hypothetical protein